MFCWCCVWSVRVRIRSFLSGLIFLVLDPATRASCFHLVEHIVSALIMCSYVCSQSSVIHSVRIIMNHEYTFVIYSYSHKHAEPLETFRSNVRKKFECLYEGTSKQGNPTMLNEIYTELYITESESGEINNEHEVRQIETQSRRAATEDTPIKCNDIFRPLPGQDKAIRTVLTKGVAGIGKTVSVLLDFKSSCVIKNRRKACSCQKGIEVY